MSLGEWPTLPFSVTPAHPAIERTDVDHAYTDRDHTARLMHHAHTHPHAVGQDHRGNTYIADPHAPMVMHVFDKGGDYLTTVKPQHPLGIATGVAGLGVVRPPGWGMGGLGQVDVVTIPDTPPVYVDPSTLTAQLPGGIDYNVLASNAPAITVGGMTVSGASPGTTYGSGINWNAVDPIIIQALKTTGQLLTPSTLPPGYYAQTDAHGNTIVVRQPTGVPINFASAAGGAINTGLTGSLNLGGMMPLLLIGVVLMMVMGGRK